MSFSHHFLVLSISRFNSVIISSEVGYEKPDGKIFRAALGRALKLLPIHVIYDTSLVQSSGDVNGNGADEIRVETSKAVHVGDDTTADKVGANAVGIDCWWVF